MAEGMSNPNDVVANSRKKAFLGVANVLATNIQFVDIRNAIDPDWRVKLSIPLSWNLVGIAMLTPLIEAGGLIFPYTPTISIAGEVNYDDSGIMHQNYQFMAYQYTKASQITITGDFNVEDGEQASYWISMVHFLRSVTKMYTGFQPLPDILFPATGNPPPILTLNAYGEYVFKNVPVVVKSFSIDLPKDCDYIHADSRLSDLPTMVGSRVPTKSTVSVTLQPTYSREAVRQFSLGAFVSGVYGLTGGYI